MKRATLGRRAVLTLTFLVAVSVAAPTKAEAQGEEKWSFVLTPQVWLTHIAKNGFASSPNGGSQGGFLVLEAPPNQNVIVQQPFPSQSGPENTLNPQWGIQIGAQKGRLTLAGSFQYVDFTTISDITYDPGPNGESFCLGSACVAPGQLWARENIDTTRMDVDLSVSYFFPDVVKDWLDVSVGGGLKFIYASASRNYFDQSPPAALIDNDLDPPGLYTVCFATNPCTSQTVDFRQDVKQKTYLVAATFPVSFVSRLTRDGNWLLPVNVTPLIGAEIRKDENVVYQQDLPHTVGEFVQQGGLVVKRIDGTTFAYGVTADATVRWVINETFSAYAGMRVQYINGHDTYLAYGPLVGMSVRW